MATPFRHSVYIYPSLRTSNGVCLGAWNRGYSYGANHNPSIRDSWESNALFVPFAMALPPLPAAEFVLCTSEMVPSIPAPDQASLR